MPENKSKFTILIDRVNASSVNQDTEFVKSVAPIFQVRGKPIDNSNMQTSNRSTIVQE